MTPQRTLVYCYLILFLCPLLLVDAFPSVWLAGRSTCYPQEGETVMGQPARPSSQNQLVLSQNGQLVSTFQPGQQYVLQMRLPTPSLYMVYASAGTLSPLQNQVNDVSRPTDGQLANCLNRAEGLLAATTQKSAASFIWTAPNAAAQPVMFRLTSATGYGSTPVYTLLTVPLATPAPVTALGTTTPVTAPVAAPVIAPVIAPVTAATTSAQTVPQIAVGSSASPLTASPQVQIQPTGNQFQTGGVAPQAQTSQAQPLQPVDSQVQTTSTVTSQTLGAQAQPIASQLSQTSNVAQQPVFQATQTLANAQQIAQAQASTPAGDVTKPYWRGRYVFQSGGTFRANSPSCPTGANQANCLPANFFTTGEAYSIVGQICIGPMSAINPNNTDMQYGRCDITIQAFWRSYFPKWKMDPSQNTACVVTKAAETSQQSIALKPVSICARLVSDCPTTECQAQLSPFTFCWSMNQVDDYYMAIDNEASGALSTNNMDGVGLKMSSVPCDFEK